MSNTKNVKNCMVLLLVLLCALPMVAHAQQASGAERMRIIVDTDIQNEMDDQHALAYTLFNSHVFEVEGVRTNSKQEREVQSFYHEALRIVHFSNFAVTSLQSNQHAGFTGAMICCRKVRKCRG